MNNSTGKLSIVATPIGNLGDMTPRAVETLKVSDVIFAEDTRNSKKLLMHFDITTSCHSLHEFSERKVFEEIIERLNKGEHVSYISDAGTPGVSDPGGFLVHYIRTNSPETIIEPIPGVSALAAQISISGIIGEEPIVFIGFLPKKKGRQTKLKEIKHLIEELEYNVVLYESPHGILKLLKDLQEINCTLVIGRELTKLHETIYHGAPDGITDQLKAAFGENIKGEFAITVLPPKK
ncbi:MAG TPA: 16S rRNA (cytidine(1402)-2'-O)-methyltransferase [Candidatus Paceibacterota bacterium]